MNTQTEQILIDVATDIETAQMNLLRIRNTLGVGAKFNQVNDVLASLEDSKTTLRNHYNDIRAHRPCDDGTLRY